MVEIVTRYQAGDGSLHESRQDAEHHEAARQIERMILGNSPHPGDGQSKAMARWIAAHLEELSTIHRYPILAEKTVNEYLGVNETAPADESLDMITKAARICGMEGK